MGLPVAVWFLRPPIVGQLQDSLPLKGLLALIERILRRIISQEVQRKLGIVKVPFLDQAHAHDVPVELERFLRVLDTEHRVVEDVSRWLGRHGECSSCASCSVGGGECALCSEQGPRELGESAQCGDGGQLSAASQAT